MFKSKFLPFIGIIIISSCTNETRKEIEVKPKDNHVLSVTDSLLKVVDEEFEHIKHDDEEHNKVFNHLISEVKQYKHTVNRLNSKIQVLEDEKLMISAGISEKDSLIDTLEGTLEQRNLRIDQLNEKIKWKDVAFREERDRYEEMVFRLEDSVSVLNNSVYELQDFIRYNVRESKSKEILQFKQK